MEKEPNIPYLDRYFKTLRDRLDSEEGLASEKVSEMTPLSDDEVEESINDLQKINMEATSLQEFLDLMIPDTESDT